MRALEQLTSGQEVPITIVSRELTIPKLTAPKPNQSREDDVRWRIAIASVWLTTPLPTVLRAQIRLDLSRDRLMLNGGRPTQTVLDQAQRAYEENFKDGSEFLDELGHDLRVSPIISEMAQLTGAFIALITNMRWTLQSWDRAARRRVLGGEHDGKPAWWPRRWSDTELVKFKGSGSKI